MQSGLKQVKNANSPDFPSYMVANENYNIRASSNPRAQLATGTGMPGSIAVKDLRRLELEGRSPLKTAAQMHRSQKREFKGWRIAMSNDFPELLSFRRDSSGSPIPVETLHTHEQPVNEAMMSLTKSPQSKTHKVIMTPKKESTKQDIALDQLKSSQLMMQSGEKRVYPPEKTQYMNRYFSGMIQTSVDDQKRVAITHSLKDKNSQIYKLQEVLKKRAEKLQHQNSALSNTQNNPFIHTQFGSEYQQSSQGIFSAQSPRRNINQSPNSAMKLTMTMCSPIFKGAQTSRKSIKSAIQEQPVSQMHEKILQNYRNYKKIYDGNQQQMGLNIQSASFNSQSSTIQQEPTISSPKQSMPYMGQTLNKSISTVIGNGFRPSESSFQYMPVFVKGSSQDSTDKGSKTHRVIKQKSPFIYQNYGPFSPPHTSIHQPIIGGDVSVQMLAPVYYNSNSAENLPTNALTINVLETEGDWRSPLQTTLNNTAFSYDVQGKKTMTSANSVTRSGGYIGKPGTSTLPSPHINQKLTQANIKVAPISQTSKLNNQSYYTNQQLLLIQEDISPLLCNQNLDHFSMVSSSNFQNNMIMGEAYGFGNISKVNDRFSKTAANQNSSGQVFQFKPSLNERTANLGGRRQNVSSRLTGANNMINVEEIQV